MMDKLHDPEGAGPYRILSKLGEGGMGTVYRARDETLQRDVTLKFFGESLAPEARRFLLLEARAASALAHPNVCTIHEVGEYEGEFFIVMELIEGKPLSAHGGSGLACETVMRYGGQIAGALAHAHARNIVHRDLKSSNIMVTPDGLVKVLDFGLARRMEVRGEGTRTMDSVESTVTTGGTLSYMSPEVLRGDPGDHRTDLWALGVVLYEIATGHVPFHGRTAFEISSAILRGEVSRKSRMLETGTSGLMSRAGKTRRRLRASTRAQPRLYRSHCSIC